MNPELQKICDRMHRHMFDLHAVINHSNALLTDGIEPLDERLRAFEAVEPKSNN